MTAESAKVEGSDAERKHIAVNLRKVGTTILRLVTRKILFLGYGYVNG